VPVARCELARFAAEAGAGEEQVEAVRLAASEAVTNVVMHAYNHDDGQIHVGADVSARQLSVRVADDGAGLRPRPDRRGLGLGLALIAQASDEFDIVKRPGGGTELRICFGLGGRSPSSGGGSKTPVYQAFLSQAPNRRT
jgi:anti-sigma regulatory factor (Ser/Thr protein kinase)